MSDDGYQRALVALDQITDEQIRQCARVVGAVAELEEIYGGMDGDTPYCPFECSWEEHAKRHDDDCPIAISRRLTEA